MNPRRFVLATAFGQAAAALVTTPLSLLAAAVAADGGDGADPRVFLALVMVAAGAIEGAITGAAQSVALVTDSSRRSFVARSALGFAIAWSVGLASSYVEETAATSVASRATALVVAGAQGLVLGLVVGVLLAPLLFARDAGSERRRFAAASALGWSAALVLAAILADLSQAPSIALELALGATRGVLVGACAASVAAWTLPRKARADVRD